jgi:hypothetical protein
MRYLCLELRTHFADKLVLEAQPVRQIAECQARIADGWEALKGGQYERGQSLFNLIGIGLLMQVEWIDQDLELLVKLDEAKWRPLVDGIEQRPAWLAMRHDSAHFVDRLFTMDRRENDPNTGEVKWRLVDPDFARGTICTGNATINIPELLATLTGFLIRARPLLQDPARAR